jgi:RNA polymerase sigma-70 factor (ECF subfamily)
MSFAHPWHHSTAQIETGILLMAENDEVMRLLLKNQNMLSVYVYSLVQDWDVVEDVVQETAVYICGHWQEFTPGTNFGAWARAIAHNRLRDAFKARQKRGLQAPDLALSSLSESVTDNEWEQYGDYYRDRKQALAKCVESLPENSRRIIQLHYDAGQPAEKIAEELKRTLDATYKMLSRIRMQLRQCVEQRVAQENS